ncbi:MAG: hypothetical protein ACFFCS_26525 [Candidatus Hodarchaeota archaeon]
MGAYCYFIFISEPVLLKTTLDELKEVFQKSSVRFNLDATIFNQFHLDKDFKSTTIGDFGKLKDFIPFSRSDGNKAGEIQELSEMLFQTIDAFGDGGELPFTWVATDEDMKAQGFEELLFSRFSKKIDGLSFPRGEMDEFYEITKEQIPLFITGCKRILANYTSQGNNDDEGVVDPNKEDIIASLERLKDRISKKTNDLDGIGVMIQAIVCGIGENNSNYNPDFVDEAILEIEKLDINVKIPDSPQESMEILGRAWSGANGIVPSIESARQFHDCMLHLLDRYPLITRPEYLHYFTVNYDHDDEKEFERIMDSLLKRMEEGINQGFNDHLCILSH